MQICLRSLIAPVRQDLDYALCTANAFRFSLLPDLLIILERLKNSSFSGSTVSTVSTFRNAPYIGRVQPSTWRLEPAEPLIEVVGVETHVE